MDREEVAPAEEDLAEGLASGGEAEDTAGEEAKLSCAEEGLLDVEVDDLFLEVLGSAVPGAAATSPAGRRSEAMALAPAGEEAAQ